MANQVELKRKHQRLMDLGFTPDEAAAAVYGAAPDTVDAVHDTGVASVAEPDTIPDRFATGSAAAEILRRKFAEETAPTAASIADSLPRGLDETVRPDEMGTKETLSFAARATASYLMFRNFATMQEGPREDATRAAANFIAKMDRTENEFANWARGRAHDVISGGTGALWPAIGFTQAFFASSARQPKWAVKARLNPSFIERDDEGTTRSKSFFELWGEGFRAGLYSLVTGQPGSFWQAVNPAHGVVSKMGRAWSDALGERALEYFDQEGMLWFNDVREAGNAGYGAFGVDEAVLGEIGTPLRDKRFSEDPEEFRREWAAVKAQGAQLYADVLEGGGPVLGNLAIAGFATVDMVGDLTWDPQVWTTGVPRIGYNLARKAFTHRHPLLSSRILGRIAQRTGNPEDIAKYWQASKKAVEDETARYLAKKTEHNAQRLAQAKVMHEETLSMLSDLQDVTLETVIRAGVESQGVTIPKVVSTAADDNPQVPAVPRTRLLRSQNDRATRTAADAESGVTLRTAADAAHERMARDFVEDPKQFRYADAVQVFGIEEDPVLRKSAILYGVRRNIDQGVAEGLPDATLREWEATFSYLKNLPPEEVPEAVHKLVHQGLTPINLSDLGRISYIDRHGDTILQKLELSEVDAYRRISMTADDAEFNAILAEGVLQGVPIEQLPVRYNSVPTIQATLTGKLYGVTGHNAIDYEMINKHNVAMTRRANAKRTARVRALNESTRGYELNKDGELVRAGFAAARPAGKAAGRQVGFTEDDLFKVGDAQRWGDPEARMLDVQNTTGGGVVSQAVEHIGDLTHRMAEKPTFETAGYGIVKDKVEKTLAWLTNPYGFAKEHAENLARTAEFRKLDPKKFKADVDNALKAYADAHAAIPVFNDAQKQAREAAVQLGRGNYDAAIKALRELQKHLDTKEKWVAYAHSGLVDASKTAAKKDPKIQFMPREQRERLTAELRELKELSEAGPEKPHLFDWDLFGRDPADKRPIESAWFDSMPWYEKGVAMFGRSLYPETWWPTTPAIIRPIAYIPREPMRAIGAIYPRMWTRIKNGLYARDFERRRAVRLFSDALEESGAYEAVTERSSAGGVFPKKVPTGSVKLANRELNNKIFEVLDTPPHVLDDAGDVVINHQYADLLAELPENTRNAVRRIRQTLDYYADKQGIRLTDRYITGYISHVFDGDMGVEILRSVASENPKALLTIKHLLDRTGKLSDDLIETDLSIILDTYAAGMSRKLHMEPLYQDLQSMTEAYARTQKSGSAGWLGGEVNRVIRILKNEPSNAGQAVDAAAQQVTVALRTLGMKNAQYNPGDTGRSLMTLTNAVYAGLLTANPKYFPMQLATGLATTGGTYGLGSTLLGAAAMASPETQAYMRLAGIDRQFIQIYDSPARRKLSDIASKWHFAAPSINMSEFYVRGITMQAAQDRLVRELGFSHVGQAVEAGYGKTIMMHGLRMAEEVNHMFGILGKFTALSRVSRSFGVAATQFLSFFPKQLEQLLSMTLKNPGAFYEYMAISGLIQKMAVTELGIDMSSYVGLGFVPNKLEDVTQSATMELLMESTKFFGMTAQAMVNLDVDPLEYWQQGEKFMVAMANVSPLAVGTQSRLAGVAAVINAFADGDETMMPKVDQQGGRVRDRDLTFGGPGGELIASVTGFPSVRDAVDRERRDRAHEIDRQKAFNLYSLTQQYRTMHGKGDMQGAMRVYFQIQQEMGYLPGMLPGPRGLSRMMTQTEQVYMIEEHLREYMNDRTTALPKMYNSQDVEAFNLWLDENKGR